MSTDFKRQQCYRYQQIPVSEHAAAQANCRGLLEGCQRCLLPRLVLWMECVLFLLMHCHSSYAELMWPANQWQVLVGHQAATHDSIACIQSQTAAVICMLLLIRLLLAHRMTLQHCSYISLAAVKHTFLLHHVSVLWLDWTYSVLSYSHPVMSVSSINKVTEWYHRMLNIVHCVISQ